MPPYGRRNDDHRARIHFGFGFPTSRFSPPVLTSFWILTQLIQLSQLTFLRKWCFPYFGHYPPFPPFLHPCHVITTCQIFEEEKYLPATRGWSSVMIFAPSGGNMMSNETLFIISVELTLDSSLIMTISFELVLSWWINYLILCIWTHSFDIFDQFDITTPPLALWCCY